MSESKKEWLILSLKWSRGSEDLVWYRPHAAGYTTDLNSAGRWTKEEARRHVHRGITKAVRESVATRYARPLLLVNNSPANLARLTGRKAKSPTP